MLKVGTSAIGTPDLLDLDDADDILRHAPDCGLIAIEDAAEAAGKELDYGGAWPLSHPS